MFLVVVERGEDAMVDDPCMDPTKPLLVVVLDHLFQVLDLIKLLPADLLPSRNLPP